ncbi:uncharacterized protein BDV14DRAFT_182262, partial [Aspergillus stella-maris]|uniref:uncharacterized protein n=1 Tax=Aspergillus stella-maris TaxID=1810926 RepID=UPI003CCD4A89
MYVPISDPSKVEQEAKQYIKIHNVAFHTKDNRILTPNQCFDAAMEDEKHRVWMRVQGGPDPITDKDGFGKPGDENDDNNI